MRWNEFNSAKVAEISYASKAASSDCPTDSLTSFSYSRTGEPCPEVPQLFGHDGAPFIPSKGMSYAPHVLHLLRYS